MSSGRIKIVFLLFIIPSFGFGRIPLERLNLAIVKATFFISHNYTSMNNVESFCQWMRINKEYNQKIKINSGLYIRSLDRDQYARYDISKKIFTDTARAASDCLDSLNKDEKVFFLTLYSDHYTLPDNIFESLSEMKDKNTVICYKSLQNIADHSADTSFVTKANLYQDMLSKAIVAFIQSNYKEMNYAPLLNVVLNSKYYKRVPDAWISGILSKQKNTGYWSFDDTENAKKAPDSATINGLNKILNNTVIALDILLRYKRVYYE